MVIILGGAPLILAAASGSDPISNLYTYGPLGLFAGIMVVVIRALLKREQERTDKAEARVLALTDRLQNETIPAIIQSTQATQAALSVMQSIKYQSDVERAARGEHK